MVDFDQTTWVQDAAPGISATQLNRIETAISDLVDAANAVGSVKYIGSSEPDTTDWEANWLWLDTSTEDPPTGGPSTVIFTESFEGGSPTDALSTSNTGFTTVTLSGTGTTAVVAASGYSGQGAEFFHPGSGAGSTQCKYSGSWTELYARLYVNLSAAPTVACAFSWLAASTTLQARLIASSSGKVGIKDGAGSTINSTASFPTDEWFRVEWQITASGQEAHLFFGANVDGDTPDEVVSTTYTGGAFDTFNIGIQSNPNTGGLTVLADEVVLDSAELPGPLT